MFQAVLLLLINLRNATSQLLDTTLNVKDVLTVVGLKIRLIRFWPFQLPWMLVTLILTLMDGNAVFHGPKCLHSSTGKLSSYCWGLEEDMRLERTSQKYIPSYG